MRFPWDEACESNFSWCDIVSLTKNLEYENYAVNGLAVSIPLPFPICDTLHINACTLLTDLKSQYIIIRCTLKF